MSVCVCVFVQMGSENGGRIERERGRKNEREKGKILSAGGEREIESAEVGGCGRILCGTVGQQECPHLGNAEEPHCNGG